MLNRIIRFSLNNRIVVLMLTAIIILAGCIVLTRSEIDIFPDLNAPTVVVMTEAPGMSPEEVEKLVSLPVESVMNGASGVRRVRSSSSTGFSVVWVEFDWGTDVYRARQTVAERLATIAGNLPKGVQSPMMGPQSSILGEVFIIGFTPKNSSIQELRRIIDTNVSKQLSSVPGVASVSVIGGDEMEMQIQLNPDKMKFYGVQLSDLLEALEESNSNAAGSVIYAHGNEYLVKGAVSTASEQEIGTMAIPTTNGGTVRLADFARVTYGPKSPKIGTASVKGDESVLVTVTKQPGAGTIQLTEELEKRLEEMKPVLPDDVTISTDIFKQSDFIDNSVSNLQVSLLEGALMVIIVLFFFLMNLRTTLVSVIAIPLSIIVTILILRAMGMTINTMTLGGIAIAIGALVDDAIVDVENVYKRLRENQLRPKNEQKTKLRVVYEASKEVRQPILNSSLIIIASFLPLFFLKGMEGRMLIPLGVAFIVSLAASTVVALTVTPVLCSYLLGNQKQNGKLSRDPLLTRWMKRGYEKALAFCLRWPTPIMILTIGLFVISIVLLFGLGRSFLPNFNEGSLTINVSALPGISLEESNRIGRLAEQIIMDTPEITTVARKTGRAELDEHSLGVNVSEIEAPYKLGERSRSDMVKDLRRRLRDIPGVSIEIGQPISHRLDAMLSGTEAQIAIKLFGSDLNQLYASGQTIKSAIHGIDGVEDVTLEQQIERPQIEIVPSRELLARYGIPMNQFTQFVDVALAGRVVSQVYQDGFPSDMKVRFEGAENLDLKELGMLPIDTPEGKVPLQSVAQIRSTTGPNTINRENGKRRLVISANVEGRDLRGAVNEISEAINNNVKLPQGYYVQYDGQFESEASASRTLALTTMGALIVIFLLLYGEFRDVRQSLVILINMPLAMIGGVLILVFTHSELNIPAIIGFISLLGIATRNGMLLMSRYNHLEEDHVGLDKRIMEGSTDRLTPIVMTALTSALALIPLALRGNEPGNEIQSPMAIVILGGLVSSTILNIFVVPILYRFICRHGKHRHAHRTVNKGVALTLTLIFASSLCASAQTRTFNQLADAIAGANTKPTVESAVMEVEKWGLNRELAPSDPEVAFGYMWPSAKEERNRWSIELTQELPDFFKRKATKNVVSALTESQVLQQEAVRAESRYDAEVMLLNYIGAKRDLMFLEGLHANIDSLFSVYERATKRGECTILDFNKVKIEHARTYATFLDAQGNVDAMAEEIVALSKGAVSKAELAKLDNYPLYPEFGHTVVKDLHHHSYGCMEGEKATVIELSDQELESALLKSPSFLARKAGLNVSDAKIALAGKERTPKFSVGYAHEFEDGTHFNGLNVGVSLPVYARKADKAAAQAEKIMAEAENEQALTDVTSNIKAEIVKANSLKLRIDMLGQALNNSNNLRLLKLALYGGEMNLLQYLQELAYFIEVQQEYNNLFLEYELSRASLARYLN